MDNEKESRWKFCAVGNIVKTRIDENGKEWHGTAAYRPGAKVYIAGRFWNEGRDTIDVIGFTRGNKYQANTVPVSVIENVRASRVFEPHVLDIMEDFEFYDCWWHKKSADRKEIKAFVERWNACAEKRKESAKTDTTNDVNFVRRLLDFLHVTTKKN